MFITVSNPYVFMFMYEKNLFTGWSDVVNLGDHLNNNTGDV